MLTYHTLSEFFAAADAAHCTPGELACRQEAEESGKSFEDVWERMKDMIPIFRQSIQEGLSDTAKSSSGLVGGDANRLFQGKMRFLSPACQRAAAYAVATAEANAKMYRIVACPTAGSCGILPAVLAAVSEEVNATMNDMTRALFTAGAIGKVVAEKASIAGAVGGCQAECGTATAMAAAAAVDLLGGTNAQMADAFALALKNILGLVCDPVGGLVEYPCQNRNATGVANALVAAEMALAGITQLIPLDEMINVMYTVGKKLPAELRETALGGCATAPSACEACHICN